MPIVTPSRSYTAQAPFRSGGNRIELYRNRGNLLEIDKESINGLEDAIRWAEVETPKRVRPALNSLVQRMALINQSEARKMSFGPYDPYQRRPAEAWRLPVRRITEAYYLGWKVRYMGPGWYQLYNDSREAYYIEVGIHHSNRRVRRPVRKLSQLRTLKYMMRTHAYHRVWSDIYLNPRRGKGRGKGFTQYVQGPAAGRFSGPLLGRRIS